MLVKLLESFDLCVSPPSLTRLIALFRFPANILILSRLICLLSSYNDQVASRRLLCDAIETLKFVADLDLIVPLKFPWSQFAHNNHCLRMFGPDSQNRSNNALGNVSITTLPNEV